METIENKRNINSQIYKVFFITSNLTNLNDMLEYSLTKNNILINLKEIRAKSISFNNEKFTIFIYPADIVENNNDELIKKLK